MDAIEIDSSNSEEDTSSLNKKRKTNNNNNNRVLNDAISKIAVALNKPEPALPICNKMETDEIDGFLTMLGCRIRKLPGRRQREVMQMHLQLSLNYFKEDIK